MVGRFKDVMCRILHPGMVWVILLSLFRLAPLMVIFIMGWQETIPAYVCASNGDIRFLQ